MPGLPLAVHENTNTGYHNHSRSVDQMCRESRFRLSEEEAIAAEESLTAYCKPVELYNILQRRSLRNPTFLQKSLCYKIEAKRKKRIQLSISLSGTLNTGEQVQSILPLYVLLARPDSDIAAGGHSAVYCLTRAGALTVSNEFERRDGREATFFLPELNKLSTETKYSKLTILLLSCGGRKNLLCERNLSKEANVGGYCLWGEIPMKSLNLSSEKCVNLSSVCGAEMMSTVHMQSCFLEPSCLDIGSYISAKIPDNPLNMHVQVRIFAQEVGAKDNAPYNSFRYDNIPTSSLSHIMRLRYGNVLFNYKYFNNVLHKTEVTEDFSCPFCLVQCASFKGLRYHLVASHDLFHFEFWVTGEYQSVIVSVKPDGWNSEVADGFDPRVENFFMCLKRRKRVSLDLSENVKHVHPHVVKSDSLEMVQEGFLDGLLDKEDGASSNPMPNMRSPLDGKHSNQISLHEYENGMHSSKEGGNILKASGRENDLQKYRNKDSNGYEDPSIAEGIECVASSPNIVGACTATHSAVGLECFQQESGSNVAPPTMLQFAKTRKLSIERPDARNRALLQKRKFFHSHRAQPMEMEQVLSDRDSEDEVDDDIADFEDRRMLDDFVDVTKDEKLIMHLWNSFVRKQRVLADGHIPWACEAFSRLHGRDLVQSPALIWCWRLFMIKLWNQSLLDAHAFDNCSKILQECEQGSLAPK